VLNGWLIGLRSRGAPFVRLFARWRRARDRRLGQFMARCLCRIVRGLLRGVRGLLRLIGGALGLFGRGAMLRMHASR
jgi:hypothetical protein